MDPTTHWSQSVLALLGPLDPRVNKRPAIWVASVTKSHTFGIHQWRGARVWRNPSSLDPPNLQVCLSEPQFTGLQWCLDSNKADSGRELQRMFLSMEFILYNYMCAFLNYQHWLFHSSNLMFKRVTARSIRTDLATRSPKISPNPRLRTVGFQRRSSKAHLCLKKNSKGRNMKKEHLKSIWMYLDVFGIISSYQHLSRLIPCNILVFPTQGYF